MSCWRIRDACLMPSQRSGSVTGCWGRGSTSVCGGRSRRRRRGRSGTAGLRRRRGRVGWRRTRCAGGCASSTSCRLRSGGCVSRARAARRPRTATPSCWTCSAGSCRTTRAATRSGCCCGRPKACAGSPTSWPSGAIRSGFGPFPGCCASSATACSPRARRWRARSIPTATPSLRTSTPPSARRSRRGSRRSASTPRRRNSSASSRTRAASGIPRARRRASTPTTSPAWPRARRSPTASTTSPKDTGFVSVGIDRDTAQFSVAAIAAWWQQLGGERYPGARCLTITADCGGSNGNRTRLWKTELQALADDTGLEIRVCHFPPGHQQVEQDRAPAVQLHLQELARTAAGLLRSHHQLDRRHDHPHRPARLRPPRRGRVPQDRSHRRTTRRRQHHTQPVPPRMELHHQTIT